MGGNATEIGTGVGSISDMSFSASTALLDLLDLRLNAPNATVQKSIPINAAVAVAT
jgi:hypothetical protein